MNGTTGQYLAVKPNKLITYRSKLELEVYQLLDSLTVCETWQAEPFYVPYLFNKVSRKYLVDALIVWQKPMLGFSKWLLEIKPSQFAQPPSQAANQFQAKHTLQNQAKWRAAQLWAEERNYFFSVLTEQGLAKIKAMQKL